MNKDYLNRITLEYDLCAFFKAWQALQLMNRVAMPGDPSNYMTSVNRKQLQHACEEIKVVIAELGASIRKNPAASGTFVGKCDDSFFSMLCALGFSYYVASRRPSFCASLIYDALFNPDYRDVRKEFSEAIDDWENARQADRVFEANVTRVQNVRFKQIASSEEDARERIKRLHRLGWFDEFGDKNNVKEWSVSVGAIREVERDWDLNEYSYNLAEDTNDNYEQTL